MNRWICQDLMPKFEYAILAYEALIGIELYLETNENTLIEPIKAKIYDLVEYNLRKRLRNLFEILVKNYKIRNIDMNGIYFMIPFDDNLSDLHIFYQIYQKFIDYFGRGDMISSVFHEHYEVAPYFFQSKDPQKPFFRNLELLLKTYGMHPQFVVPP